MIDDFYECAGACWRRPRRTAVAAFAAGLAVVACERAPANSRVVPQVTVAEVTRAGTDRDVRLSGTIDAERTSALGFADPGTVEAVLVNEGDVVRRGQALARLFPRSFVDALGIAKAKAAQAEDAYQRFEPMHRNQTLPEIKWVEVQTGRQQAELAVSLAQKAVDDTVLRAPEDGVVSRRSVEPGSSALPGAVALTIVQTRKVLAIAPVAETQIARVRVGQAAQVVVTALGKTYDGTVQEIGVFADPLTRTYPVKIALDNSRGDLRVGMVCEVHLRQETGAPALAVPPAAVRVDESGGSYVYVVTPDNTVHRKPVVIAGFVGERTAISQGLAAGDRVVVSGTPMLADGVTVVVAANRAIPGVP